MRDMEKVHESA